jgi:hypothetical protein
MYNKAKFFSFDHSLELMGVSIAVAEAAGGSQALG